jgi:hypothetical protein
MAGGTGAPPSDHGQDAQATSELARPRTAQSFCVPRADLAAQGYDLSLKRYKEVVHAEVAHRPPGEILASLAELEKEFVLGMKTLEETLKRVRTTTRVRRPCHVAWASRP